MSDDQPGMRGLLIEEEMKESYLTYAMSVLIDRALPDIRDGLKPVHRRILFSMRDLNLGPGNKYQKSAKIVGQCIGNYHPHGDSAVYDAMVRMAQDFSLRYELVDGQGNFGSIEGDAAAAYRYTEARMTRLASEMLDDIQYDTVDTRPNFDESREEPTVLPSRLPNLLVNGSSGIAVGMATNIPPHNVREICEAARHLIQDPEATVTDLMEHVRAPDFPTGGIVCGTHGARQAYETGRGRVVLRAKIHVEELTKNREALVVTEVPYGVKLSTIIESMTRAVREERLTGVSNIYGGTVKEGIRLVIELKAGEDTDVVLNQLWKHTLLQSSFSINMIALDGGRPRTVGLKRMLQAYIDHRREVIVRRTRFLLARDEARLHIVAGLLKAIDIIDEIIALIRASASTDEARTGLMERWDFSERQAQAILDMQLRRLTGLERDKLQAEHDDLEARIADYRDILARDERQFGLIMEDLDGLIEKYGDERRSVIGEPVGDFDIEDLIEDEDCVVTITASGYIKRLPVDTYRVQRRGGKGVTGGKLKEDDQVAKLFLATLHQYLLVFTTKGRLHWIKVYAVPQGSRTSRGRALVNLVELEEGEDVAVVLPVREFSEDRHLCVATASGRIKKTVLSAYSRPRAGGIKAVKINDDDTLIGATITDDDDQILLASDDGQACRFAATDCRPMGRDTAGVAGMNLASGARVVSLVACREDAQILTICEQGYGKRTPLSEYRLTRRGGKGVRNILCSERNGAVVASLAVNDCGEIMMISRRGMVVRTRVEDISILGRNTQGVRLFHLAEDDGVIAVAWGEEEAGDEQVVSDIPEVPDTEASANGGSTEPEDSSEPPAEGDSEDRD